MKLKTDPTYPQAWTYVLKLHREAAPTEGRIVGRLEHLATGREHYFTSADELIASIQSSANGRPVATEPANPTQE